MASYLITWKPDSENKEKGWPEAALIALFHDLKKTGSAQEPWRFIRRQGVKLGERVYLLRQGRRGHAILGYGFIAELPASKNGNTTIGFDVLVDPRAEKVLATHEELHSISEQPGVWNSQASGIILAPEIALQLEGLVLNRAPVDELKLTPLSANPDWTRDELILALDLYFRVPSARGSKTHAECVRLSEVLNQLPIHRGLSLGDTFRNPNGVGMKLSNFLKFDPLYKGKGLTAGSHLEEEVWDTFSDDQSKLRKAAEAILAGGKELIEAGVSAVTDDDDEESEEGRILTRVHKLRERDPALAKRKKQRVLGATGALKCEICSFDFAVTYGVLGTGFAECHHGRALSTLKPGEKTKLSELHIVCANCHRMLHRSRPWPSIGQLTTCNRP